MAGILQTLKRINHSLRPKVSKSTDIYVVYPAPAATTYAITAADVTAGADFATWGDTDEIVSSVTSDCWIDGIFVLTSDTPAETTELQIGVGASGSETWLATIEYKGSELLNSDLSAYFQLAIPIYVPAGGRIAQRSRGEGNAKIYTVVFCREGLK